MKRWKPNREDLFYYIVIEVGEMFVDDVGWLGCPEDEGLFRNHNVFRTKKEALAALKRVKAALKGG